MRSEENALARCQDANAKHLMRIFRVEGLYLLLSVPETSSISTSSRFSSAFFSESTNCMEKCRFLKTSSAASDDMDWILEKSPDF